MTVLRHAAFGLTFAAIAMGCAAAHAASEFPFGLEMTLEARPQPGSKRIPRLEIGENGEAQLDLWCKAGKGQFSVANNTVIFVPGPMQESDGCSSDRAQADDALVNALAEAATWTRRGDYVSFVGATTLRFRLNTN